MSIPPPIKVDEDLPREVATLLRKAGYDAKSVFDQHLIDMKDGDLWPVIQKEGRCLFTADKGFADVRLRQAGEHHGVVLFRHPNESRSGYIRLVEYWLRHFKQEDFSGSIAVVSPDAIRIHRPG